MKRILTLLSVAVTLLFAANSANAAPLGLADLSPASPSYSPAGGIGVSAGPIDDTLLLNLSGAPAFLVSIAGSGSFIGSTGIQALHIDLDGFPSTDTTNGSAHRADIVNHYLVAGAGYIIHITGLAGTTGGSYSLVVNASALPVPGAFLLFGSGLAALGFAGRAGRKARKTA